MSNELPADYHADRMNYQHSTQGGAIGHATPSPLWNAIKPTTWFTAIGHAVTKGRNGASQLTHTFGN
jgi:hypothetical protein